jgi:hypothetical protein
MKRTIAALATGLVLGSAGVGIAATSGMIHMGYNVACEKNAGSQTILCVAKGNHANLGVAISTKMVAVINAKTGAVLYVKAQR